MTNDLGPPLGAYAARRYNLRHSELPIPLASSQRRTVA